MDSGTVKAGLGFRAATVPLGGAGFPRLLRWLWLIEMVRFLESSDSIFFLIAWRGEFSSSVKLTCLFLIRDFKMGIEEGCVRPA